MCEDNHEIVIKNFNINDEIIVNYSLVILKGEVISKTNSNFLNFRLKNNNNEFQSKYLIKNNKFLHLIKLHLGVNEIKVQYCCKVIDLTITFKPNSSEYCIVPVYIICKNHDGLFQSPTTQDNSITSACERITIGTELIQSLIAEKFHESNLSRKTFQLESDLYTNAPKCRIFNSNIDVETARTMNQNELWHNFGCELIKSRFAHEKKKYLAFLSCTQYRGDKFNENINTYDDIVNITEGYVALGGGGLAIFGTACLFTWPTKIEDIINCFQDQTLIDKSQFMDDSCYRGTYGGCFATTLGSVCHELCHTFDLGHSTEGIMARGFDAIDSEFSVDIIKKDNQLIQLKSQSFLLTPNANIQITQNILPFLKKLNPYPNKLNLKEGKKCGIFWSHSCLILLYYHKWLNKTNNQQHTLKYKNFTISSSAGISIIEIRNEDSGLVLNWWDFSNQPKYSFNINDNLFNCNNNEPCIVIVEDIVGNIIKEKLL